MKKLLLGLFVLMVMLFSYITADACSKNCDCGCNNGKACTCIKDDKGNVFRSEVINVDNLGKTDDKCVKKCRFKKFLCKNKCKKEKSVCSNCNEKCKKECKCSCHKSCHKLTKCQKDEKTEIENSCSIEKIKNCQKTQKKKHKFLFWKNKLN